VAVGALATALAAITGLIVALRPDGAGKKTDTNGATPATSVAGEAGRKEYERRVREICADRAGLERRTKERTEAMQAGFATAFGSPESYATFVKEFLTVNTEATGSSESLKNGFKALDPPSSAEPIHNDAVTAWENQLRLERRFLDDARSKLTQGPEPFGAFLASYDASEVRKEDARVNEYLVRLAVSGCRPSL
jgi:hypothetical protein